MFKQWLARISVALLLICPVVLWAAESESPESSELRQSESGQAEPRQIDSSNPQLVIEGVTAGLLGLLSEFEGRFETEPEAYFAALDELLNDVVDFTFIATNVMGPYRKTATPVQLEEFEKVFRLELIETYGRGLFSYSNQEIILIPLEEDLEGKKRVTLRQEIHNGDKVYPLNYSMGLNREGQWKVTNLVINGINLGKTFRNQFLQRAREFDGNIDQVINNWAADVQAG